MTNLKKAYLITSAVFLPGAFVWVGIIYAIHAFGGVEISWVYIWMPMWLILGYLIVLPLAFLHLLYDMTASAEGRMTFPSPGPLIVIPFLLVAGLLNKQRQIDK